MTSLADIRVKVRNRVNLSSTDNRILDADLTDFINQAAEDLWTMDDWPWKEELTTGQITSGVNTLAMAATNRAVLGITVSPEGVTNPNYTNLSRKTWKWCQRYRNVNGVPRFYCEHADTLYIFPTANKTFDYEIRNLKNRVELVGDADIVASPEHFDRLLVTRAAMYVADKLRDSELNQMLANELRTWVQETKVDVVQTRDQMGIMIRSDWAV